MIYLRDGGWLLLKMNLKIYDYRSKSLSQNSREWKKYFELFEVWHKQNVTSPKYYVPVRFLQDILLQYMCSKTVPTDNLIEMKTKEIHLSLYYFHFNNVVDCIDATALVKDKQYGRNRNFLILGNG